MPTMPGLALMVAALILPGLGIELTRAPLLFRIVNPPPAAPTERWMGR
jgi:hypothetical protein